MAYDENLRCRSLDADSSVGFYTGPPGQPGSAVPNSGKQYCLVKLTGKHQCGLMVASGEAFVGVLQNKPQGAGFAATVAYEGVTKVIAGAAYAVGTLLTADNAGRAVEATSGDIAVLMAESAAAGADEVISASFIPGGQAVA